MSTSHSEDILFASSFSSAPFVFEYAYIFTACFFAYLLGLARILAFCTFCCVLHSTLDTQTILKETSHTNKQKKYSLRSALSDGLLLESLNLSCIEKLHENKKKTEKTQTTESTTEPNKTQTREAEALKQTNISRNSSSNNSNETHNIC